MADSNLFYTPAEYNATTADILQAQNNYVQDMQNQFAQETQTGRRSFTRTAEDLATQAKQFAEDYALFTGREQQAKNQQLAATNKQFAGALSQAADAYGQRGILNSGIAIKNAQVATGDYALANQKINQSYDQAQQDRNIALQRQNQRYGINKQRLGEDLATYNEKAKIGAETTTQQAMRDFNAAGILGAYGGSVESLNQANAQRKQRNLNPAMVGMGGIPILSNPR